MFFRFISAIVLVVLVSMTGIVIEKRMLDLRRDVSRQQYRTEILLDQYTMLRLKTQQLSSPDRMLETMQQQQLAPQPLPRQLPKPNMRRMEEPNTEEQAARPQMNLPLMKWERPVQPFRLRRKDLR
ncbi:MAG: hypothetical protein AB8G99_01640 [Planctomycetaceae bacterium]